MTILITGANGFIGKQLHRHFLNRGFSVRGVVRHRDKQGDDAQDCVELDAPLETFDWTRILDGVDTIVHTAARVHVFKETSRNPREAFNSVNVQGTLNLARYAARAGVHRFVFFSSIGVHGSEWAAPITEQSNLAPQTPYAESKLRAEKELESVCSGSEMEFVIIRPPLVFGAGAPGNIDRLVRLVRFGLPLPFRGVNNRRSVVSIANLCAFVELCVTRPEAAGEVFLVADNEAVSTMDMVNAIAEGLGRKSVSFYFPPSVIRLLLRLLGQSRLYAQLFRSLEIDTGKARELLGWSGGVPTRDALREMSSASASEQ
ncbi:NAD-dependent epimerase/dehydratase family protein [Motiliproteus sediminis]|uniref:NAD-dependent epimerase/dehydratase family protein n=1 Tax=Motiliproteus sediminis TaxID=1468178 RepID=UPI001AEFD4C8|nr:NAD-dependent epimerase/dehydratase family protein [Motiliproteus sediminis]